MTPTEDLICRLRKRAEIRRSITTRKSVQNNEPDRIADLLEEAAVKIEHLQRIAAAVAGMEAAMSHAEFERAAVLAMDYLDPEWPYGGKCDGGCAPRVCYCASTESGVRGLVKEAPGPGLCVECGKQEADAYGFCWSCVCLP